MNKKLIIYKKIRKILGGRGIGGIPLIKNLNDYAVSHIHSEFVNVHGNKMFLDPSDSLNLSIKEIHEPFETKLIENIINNGDFVIDVGAHIGYYTLFMAKLVGENGKVFAFEPHPLNFKILKKNIELNNYQNVIFENKAVSNKNGKTNLYISKKNSGMHRIHPSKYCEEKIPVDLVKLNDYFQQSVLNKICLIKIDAEGSEFEVLKGMSNALKNSQIKILMEFVPEHLIEHGTQPSEMLNFLSEHGFKIFYIDENIQKVEKLKNWTKTMDEFPNGVNLLCEK